VSIAATAASGCLLDHYSADHPIEKAVDHF
jgi:hypothetical protein